MTHYCNRPFAELLKRRPNDGLFRDDTMPTDPNVGEVTTNDTIVHDDRLHKRTVIVLHQPMQKHPRRTSLHFETSLFLRSHILMQNSPFFS